ncbi:REP-associated tyrosine transposase [Celerinatantimonas sp. YJH-8]|uniref:REP-associated tyrosine transposase n=1 Tax=Celerinatantimonas sp. YJH-8 TaxID=3228714 RepID=UPI0038C78226
MVAYRRFYQAGGCYFLTLTLANRHSTLLTTCISEFKLALRYALERYPCHLQAIVVLPEHLHMLLQLPQGQLYYPKFVQSFKSRFSFLLHQGGSLNHKIWQDRYWEHCIRGEADWLQHLEYIHRNPVKHHQVSQVKNWPYSSFHRYVAEGWLDENWLGDDPSDGLFGE